MVRLEITKTGKSYSPRSHWTVYDKEAHDFETLADAKAWVRENIPKGKRSPIYVDTKSRGTIKTGYVIGFRVNDFRDRHLEQWWLSFAEIIRHPTEGRAGELRSLELGRA